MDYDLDDTSGVPRYLQVARRLEAAIRAGEFEPGTVIPSQPQVIQAYGVAKTTASKAFARLADRGLVAAVPGIGTVVLPRARWASPEEYSNPTRHLAACYSKHSASNKRRPAEQLICVLIQVDVIL